MQTVRANELAGRKDEFLMKLFLRLSMSSSHVATTHARPPCLLHCLCKSSMAKQFSEYRVVSNAHLTPLLSVVYADSFDGVGQHWKTMRLDKTKHDYIV